MSDPDRYICFQCQSANCTKCVDVLAVVFDTDLECNCQRIEHSGEPNRQQIVDPVTGAVHGPGLVVEESGEVVRNDNNTNTDKGKDRGDLL